MQTKLLTRLGDRCYTTPCVHPQRCMHRCMHARNVLVHMTICTMMSSMGIGLCDSAHPYRAVSAIQPIRSKGGQTCVSTAPRLRATPSGDENVGTGFCVWTGSVCCSILCFALLASARAPQSPNVLQTTTSVTSLCVNQRVMSCAVPTLTLPNPGRHPCTPSPAKLDAWAVTQHKSMPGAMSGPGSDLRFQLTLTSHRSWP